jgi:hypothetical protein
LLLPSPVLPAQPGCNTSACCICDCLSNARCELAHTNIHTAHEAAAKRATHKHKHKNIAPPPGARRRAAAEQRAASLCVELKGERERWMCALGSVLFNASQPCCCNRWRAVCVWRAMC